MAKTGYKSRSLPDEVIQGLQGVAKDYEAQHGVTLTEPAVIKLLLNFYRKNGTNPSVTKGNHETT